MKSQRRAGTKRTPTVLATGVFDILHPGHIKFLEESKRRGGRGAQLVVVVARDATVRQRKGRDPTIPESQRLEMVKALRAVDRAILGHPKLDLLGVLREEKPDLVAVGHDQNQIKSAVMKVIMKAKLPIRVVQIREFGPRRLNSSTKVKSEVAKEYRLSSR